MTPTTESFEFRAETTRLLNLVVNSLYTTKDIFLRELISNASDALDRLRFESLTSPGLVPEDHRWEIRLEPDAEHRTLTIHDTGIGMSRDEVIENLGTIAKSGTRELLQKAADEGDREVLSRLIGQFGVGFYSVFMVADKVSLVTRRAGEERGTFWESSGDGRFDVSESSRGACGTSITLHLKPVDEEAGLLDFADPNVLRDVVIRYSNFITYPVICPMPRLEYERDEEGKIVPDGASKTVVEDQTLNAMKPLWLRPEAEVEDDEYAEFYRHITHDWTEPLKRLNLRAEGRLEYRALLFIPARAPLDIGLVSTTYGLQLFAKSVLIMEACEDLLPPFLRFVRGVVDSADLPLNVSREMLQQDRHINQIRTFLTGRVLKALAAMKQDDADTYLTFWKEFGRVLKEGMLEQAHRDKVQELLLFATLNREDGLASLAEIREGMQEGQDALYYLTGESRAVIANSPHLEAFRARGIDVLLLDDPVDELVVQHLAEYDGVPLRSAAKGEVELGDEEERKQAREKLDERTEGVKPLLEALGKHLEDRVREVRLSDRLKDSPACLVGSEYDLSPQLERLLRQSGQDLPRQKRILELNPEHAVLRSLEERFALSPDDQRIGEVAELLHSYALLSEGSALEDPARFSRLFADLLSRGV